MKPRTGFTLIELLVVIAIIGILSGIIMASLNGARANSRDGKRISDIAQLQLSLESYYDACKQFPPTLALTQGTGCPSGVTLGTFIPSIPTAPSPGSAYVYETQNADGTSCSSSSVCKSYCLGATLENGNNSSILTQCTLSSGSANHRVKP